jgi:hypothetical protein
MAIGAPPTVNGLQWSRDLPPVQIVVGNEWMARHWPGQTFLW